MAKTRAANSVTISDGTSVPLEDVAHITADLRPLAVAIDTLQPDPRNARTHGDQNRDAVARSLRKSGQLKPITIDGNGIILTGNCTWETAKSIGWKYIARVRTELTGPQAMAWALADNRTAELAEWDAKELERQTAELAQSLEGFTLADVGLDDEQIAALLAGDVRGGHGFAPKPPLEDPPAGDQDYPSVFKIILTCASEAHQAELIEEFERRGFEFKAPNVT